MEILREPVDKEIHGFTVTERKEKPGAERRFCAYGQKIPSDSAGSDKDRSSLSPGG